MGGKGYKPVENAVKTLEDLSPPQKKKRLPREVGRPVGKASTRTRGGNNEGRNREINPS